MGIEKIAVPQKSVKQRVDEIVQLRQQIAELQAREHELREWFVDTAKSTKKNLRFNGEMHSIVVSAMKVNRVSPDLAREKLTPALLSEITVVCEEWRLWSRVSPNSNAETYPF